MSNHVRTAILLAVLFWASRTTTGTPAHNTVALVEPTVLATTIDCTYDDLSRQTQADYDLSQELDADQQESFVLDLLSNRDSYTTRAEETIDYEHASGANGNPDNRYTAIDGTGVEYDAAGNLVLDEDGYRYTYDYAHRLTQIDWDEDPADPNNPLLPVVNFHYHADGRRSRMIVYGDADNAAPIEPVPIYEVHFFYDGPRVIEEWEALNDEPTYYVEATVGPAAGADAGARLNLAPAVSG